MTDEERIEYQRETHQSCGNACDVKLLLAQIDKLRGEVGNYKLQWTAWENAHGTSKCEAKLKAAEEVIDAGKECLFKENKRWQMKTGRYFYRILLSQIMKWEEKLKAYDEATK